MDVRAVSASLAVAFTSLFCFSNAPAFAVAIPVLQDRRVRLYDTQRNWQLRKDVTTRMTRWTITDTTLSPDQRLLVYASISPVAFVVNVGSSGDPVSHDVLVCLASGDSASLPRLSCCCAVMPCHFSASLSSAADQRLPAYASISAVANVSSSRHPVSGHNLF
jgi:hypothetical protein